MIDKVYIFIAKHLSSEAVYKKWKIFEQLFFNGTTITRDFGMG